MGVISQTVNNKIVEKAVLEVGKFVGVKFTEEQARLFLDSFCAVLGKYFYDNPDVTFHLNKYVISKRRNGKYSMFDVQIYRQDPYIKNPDDLYDYYMLEGKERIKLMHKLEDFASGLIEASMSEEYDNTEIINKLKSLRKNTPRRLSRWKNNREQKEDTK